MTCVTFLTDPDGAIRGFETDGHAGFAEKGEDIVCAAISALTINTVNSVETFAEDLFDCDEDEERGNIKFLLKAPASKEAKLLLDSYRLGIEEISKTYGHRFVRIGFKEV